MGHLRPPRDLEAEPKKFAPKRLNKAGKRIPVFNPNSWCCPEHLGFTFTYRSFPLKRPAARLPADQLPSAGCHRSPQEPRRWLLLGWVLPKCHRPLPPTAEVRRQKAQNGIFPAADPPPTPPWALAPRGLRLLLTKRSH